MLRRAEAREEDIESMNPVLVFRTAAIAASLATRLAFAGPPNVTVDGHDVRFPDMQPRMIVNHVMVPLRGVFEKMHANVDYDATRQRITCIKDDATVQLILGDKVATVNGQTIYFDAPAMLSHGRTLVPLRFLAQALGAQVDWDDVHQTVKITSPAVLHRAN